MIDKSVWLACSVTEAFALFTERIGEWWPESHRPGKDPRGQLFLLESGRFFERTSDGRELDLGRVTDWQAPTRLTLDFYLGTGPQHPTAVTITFEPEEGGTRVSVHHRPKAESLHLWDSKAPIYVRSWEHILPSLVRLLA